MVAIALLFAPMPVRADDAPQHILSFDGGTAWLNSKPLTTADLRGKVVLVDFWEYTCINCLRTLPYLRTWWKRYGADGFVIVGVHTPEFGFSGEDKNVAAATQRLDIGWPVVLDSRETIWNRYGNEVWPHELLYDQKGNLVESMEGEGGYPETEAKIQALLRAANRSLQLPPVMALLPQDSYDRPGALCYPKTGEIYAGGERGHIANAPISLASKSPETQYVDTVTDPVDGEIYLAGYWRRTPQAMVSADNSGRFTLKYHAIQVVTVMRPEESSPVEVVVEQDGMPLAHDDAGSDVKYDAQGRSYVLVDAPRAYDVIDNKKWGSHVLQLLPQHYGLGVYSFDFESCEAS